jgi:hypothetical protein
MSNTNSLTDIDFLKSFKFHDTVSPPSRLKTLDFLQTGNTKEFLVFLSDLY